MSVIITGIKPTVFYRYDDGKLMRKSMLELANTGSAASGTLQALLGGAVYKTSNANVIEGNSSHPLWLPEFEEIVDLEAEITLSDGRTAKQKMIWKPGKHWTVHILPIAHHDLGYTNAIEPLLDNYDAYYDDVLAICKKTDSLPDEAKYRYTVEESWSLLHYLERRPPAVIEDFMRLVNAGRIEVSAFYANIVDSFCSHEELIRLLYPSFELRRKYGIPISTASLVDMPGLAWGLPAILASVGIKHLFGGMPDYFEWGEPAGHTFWDEKNILRPHGRPDAFIWEGADGSRVNVYYSGSYGYYMRNYEKKENDDELSANIEAELDALEERGCPFDVARFLDYGWDNYPPQEEISYFVERWNRKYAYPKLVVSTNARFFEAVEKEYKDLRVFRGDIVQTDYNACMTSAAYETGLNRRTHERAQAAERFQAVAQILVSNKTDAGEMDSIYADMMLYDEHCFGLAFPYGKMQDWSWNSKRHYALRAAAKTEELLTGSVEFIASLIERPRDGKFITVFNSMSYTRSDIVRLPDYTDFDKDFTIVDISTGREVPWQIDKIYDPHLPRPYASQRYAAGLLKAHVAVDLCFIAEDVPPVGYKTYRVELRKPEMEIRHSLIVGSSHLENRYYKIACDPNTGAVRCIWDKQGNFEWVDGRARHMLNQLIVKQVNGNLFYSPEKAEITVSANGPLFASLLVKTSCTGCPQAISEIIIYHDLDRIDFNNRILKDASPMQEIYYAFPFEAEKPEFTFESPMTPIQRAFEDQLPGTNTNFYSVQHWAAVSGSKKGFVISPVDSGLVQFGGLWPLPISQAHHGVDYPGFGKGFVAKGEASQKGHMYAPVLTCNFTTNFASVQVSDCLFRFSLGKQNGEKDARQFGWSAANPLIACYLEDENEGPLPPEGSFLTISEPNVMLYALKPAQDGNGIVIRVTEMEGRMTTATVTLPFMKITYAGKLNLVEQNEQTIDFGRHQVKVSLKPFEVVTIRLASGKRDVSRYRYWENFSEEKVYY